MSKKEPSKTPGRQQTVRSRAQALEIRVVDLHNSFGENEVLRGIDLEIQRGELVVIVGASGSGKTVLLQHLICHYIPEPGHVFMADHETEGSPLVDVATLDEAGLEHLRRHWAVVFQKNALFTGTVYDNIALGLVDKGMDEEQIRRRADDVMKAVGLEPEEVLKLDRDELSGGMAKRVAIARALALDPVLVFYDEPTTGLDPSHAHQIQDLIQEIHHRTPELKIERTSVIISHDTGLLKRLEPRIVMIDKGKICFDGTFDEFEKSDSPIIRPYFEDMPGLHKRAV